MDYVTLAKQAVRGLEDASVDRHPSVERRSVPAPATATKAIYATKGVADYATLARSGLVARVRAAWPWLGENRADLYAQIQDADEAVPRDAMGNPDAAAAGYADAVERLREAMEAASRAYADRRREASVRIFSKVLGAELWIAPDEQAAAELQREGVTLPVLLPAEAMILGRMAESDARALLAALAKIQRVIPGSRLRSVEGSGADA